MDAKDLGSNEFGNMSCVCRSANELGHASVGIVTQVDKLGELGQVDWVLHAVYTLQVRGL
jgi:hypothetical protein